MSRGFSFASGMAGGTGNNKALFLFAFDFDHTIIDANSDLQIQEAYNTEPVPEYLKVVAKDRGWVTYMQEMYRFHYTTDVSRKDFHQELNSMPFVPNMPECFAQLKKLGGELIVISDANTYFIRHTLQHHRLLKHFNDVFANPSHFDHKGQLIIR